MKFFKETTYLTFQNTIFCIFNINDFTTTNYKEKMHKTTPTNTNSKCMFFINENPFSQWNYNF